MSYGAFLRGLLKDPRGVSAPTPSSPALAKTIAAKVDPLQPGLVVELGAGTGVVTAALLDRGITADRLLIIERGGYFYRLLAKRFPAAAVIQGDAFAFEQYLPPGAAISAVVCGIPLLNFPLALRRTLIERALGLQGPGGRFIQLSYGWKPPIRLKDVELGKTIVWRNFPPAHVWTFGAQTEEAKAGQARLGLAREWRARPARERPAGL